MRGLRRSKNPRNPKKPRSTSLARLRGLRLDRNPLRRGSDRAETIVLGVLLAAFLTSAPFAAHAAGNWTYAASAREAQVQQSSVHQVPATLLQAATPWALSEGGAEAQARWKAPDGQVRTGQVFVASLAPAGSTVTVWVNQAGQLADSPLQHNQVSGRAVIAQVLAVTVLAVVLIIIGWAARWVLDRRRLAAWDAEWLTTERRWSSRN
jgi:hypothetical protein